MNEISRKTRPATSLAVALGTRWLALSRMLLCILLFTLADRGGAWTSGPESKQTGPDEAQISPPWGWYPGYRQSTDNEHAALLWLAMQRGGLGIFLRADPRSPYEATVYTRNKNAPGTDKKSALPAILSGQTLPANAKTVRTYTIPGFASLPDHSFSLGDWAAGNEICPPGVSLNPVIDPIACHDFDHHIGPLNSTHFPPQANVTYRWYHQLAMQRATACGDMGTRFTKTDFQETIQRSASEEAVMECEREALLIEAIGQHFLQDTWAIGHMWERWGYPTFPEFANGPRGALSTQEVEFWATAVGITSGLIHGAEAILHVPDEMSAGGDPDVNWASVSQASVLHPGIGDFHYLDLLGSAQYYDQREALLNCSASGLRDVYDKTAKYSGRVPPYDGVRVDPTSSACSGQRATNAAIFKGMGVSCPQAFVSDKNTSPSDKLLCASFDSQQWLIDVAGHLSPTLRISPSIDQLYTFRNDLIRIALNAKVRAKQQPGGTDLSSLGLARSGVLNIQTFLGVPRNGAATSRDPPATYAEPALPWAASTADAPEWAPNRWIASTFHRAHLSDWCESPEASPAALKASVAAAANRPEKAIACEICTEFVSRHEALPGSTSLCVAANASPAFLTVPSKYSSAAQGAAAYCGCVTTSCGGEGAHEIICEGEDYYCFLGGVVACCKGAIGTSEATCKCPVGWSTCGGNVCQETCP